MLGCDCYPFAHENYVVRFFYYSIIHNNYSISGAFGFQRRSPPADKRIITTTRSHMTKAVKDAIDNCNPTEVLKVGGSGHKVTVH